MFSNVKGFMIALDLKTGAVYVDLTDNDLSLFS
jgi:hypothetical protein